jgi:hypothetical protein
MSMVHVVLLFYIGFMTLISICKNVEWVSKKVLLLRDWYRNRGPVKCEYLAPM